MAWKFQTRPPRRETQDWLVLDQGRRVGEPDVKVRRYPGGPGTFQLQLGYSRPVQVSTEALMGALDEMGVTIK